MAVINPNRASIIYQATTVMLEKVTAATRTRNKANRKKLYAEASRIRYYLTALTFYPTYIDAEKANQILQCLIVTSGIQNYPVPPVTSAPSNPVSSVALVGDTGPAGPRGNDGGATDFAVVNVNGNQVIDSFSVSSAYAARWDYIINGTAQRAGTVYATWTEDGAAVDYTEISTPDINGTTIGSVAFTVTYSAGVINFNAVVSAGLWDIRGSRYFIPNQGLGVVPASTPLPSGQIFVGNASSIATAVAVTGDIGITSGGVASISSGVIVDADVNASAAIAVSKLAALPNNTAVVLTDGSGKLTSIANGTAGFVLTSNGASAPTWQAVSGTGTVTSVSFAWSGSGLSFTGPITTTGTISTSGTLAAIVGGTGQNFYANGDLLYGTSSNTLNKLTIGSANQVLTVSGGFPAWSSSISASILPATVIQRSATLNTLTIPRASSGNTIEDGSLVDDGTDVATNGAIRIFGGISTLVGGVLWKKKIIEIGDWDMDANQQKAVAHGLTLSKIRTVSTMIRDDAGTNQLPLNGGAGVGNENNAGNVDSIDATNVNLYRVVGSLFDSTNYNATGYNRGWVTIEYEV